ncbi:MAG: hypothetical protein M0R37_12565 [Bacteroidales bacterium]|nr:hypothetical protein [Bacteroidales bacterium]
MAKPKKNTSAGNYTKAEIAKTPGTLGASVAGFRDEVTALRKENANMADAFGTLLRRVEQLEAPVLPSVTLVGDGDDPILPYETLVGDNAAANAATREALHKEIAVVVEQRLAGAYMDATSAQIANVESRMRSELQALLEKALAFDGAIGKSIRDAVAARTAAAAPDRSGEQPSRGHRSAVRPVTK